MKSFRITISADCTDETYDAFIHRISSDMTAMLLSAPEWQEQVLHATNVETQVEFNKDKNVHRNWKVRFTAIGPNKVQVMRQVRDQFGYGLKESKEIVDAGYLAHSDEDRLSYESALEYQVKLGSVGASSTLEEEYF